MNTLKHNYPDAVVAAWVATRTHTVDYEGLPCEYLLDECYLGEYDSLQDYVDTNEVSLADAEYNIVTHPTTCGTGVYVFRKL